MMFKIYKFILGVLLTTMVSACSNNDPEPIKGEDPQPVEEENKRPPVTKYADGIELSAEGIQGVKSQNNFAFSVFKEVCMDSKETNTLLSPISLTTCVSMLANATSNDATRQTINTLMGEGITIEKFNEVNKYLLDQLVNIDSNTSFMISNSAWLHNSYSFLPDFENKMKRYYNSHTATLDLYSDGAMNVINNWTKESTKGLIPILFKSAPCADFILANSIYFNGNWVAEFNPDETKKGSFNNIDGTRIEVDMMTMNSAPFHCFVNEECSAVRLPYGNQAFSFYAILPDESLDLNNFIINFDNQKWDKIFSMTHYASVDIELPKFEVSYDNDKLADYMAKVGLDETFGGGCEIPNIAGSVIKGNLKCLQKSTFNISETGAEGASVTSLIMYTASDGGGGIPKHEIKLNRPFLYVVAEKSTGAIIFIGSVVKL